MLHPPYGDKSGLDYLFGFFFLSAKCQEPGLGAKSLLNLFGFGLYLFGLFLCPQDSGLWCQVLALIGMSLDTVNLDVENGCSNKLMV